MESRKIKVGLTQGDINGTGYELILKALEDPSMLELMTPVVFGSPKVAAFHKKVLQMELPFNITAMADEAPEGAISLVNACDDDVKVDLQHRDAQAASAAFSALNVAVEELQQEMFDTLVMLPVDRASLRDQVMPYLRDRLFQGRDPLPVLVRDDCRVALATGPMPLPRVLDALTPELIRQRIQALADSLSGDFGIRCPRIAVLSLDPGAGMDGDPGDFEREVLLPIVEEMSMKGLLVFGPYSVSDLLSQDLHGHFDGILALYFDQGMALFRAMVHDEGACFLALDVPGVVTMPLDGPAYDRAGKGEMDCGSLRQAIYLGMDILRWRRQEASWRRNPLRRQYFDRRDDSDRLKQLAREEDEA